MRILERFAPQRFRAMRRRTFAFGTCSCHSFHHAIYLRICTVTCAFVGLTRSCGAGTFRSLRAAGAAESGNRGRDPWESRKADWAHLLVRLGQLTSCAGGEAREAPKPNERVLRPGNQDGCERLLGAPEPEGPTVAGGFGFRRAEGPSGSSFLPGARVHGPAHGSLADAGLVRPAERGYRSQVMATGTGTETNERREQIVDVAMRHFAEHGYRGAHVEDIAAEVGVAKGTVFLHFGNKEGLFLAVYREAVGQLPAWLDAPADVVGGRVLGRPGLLAPPDRGVPHRAVGGEPGRDDRAVRHRAGAPAADRPADAERGPVRDARVRRVRGPSRRDPRRRRRRDDRLDARLGRRTLPGRPRQRGARPRSGPPQALRPRTARGADPGVPRAPALGHLPAPGRRRTDRPPPDVRPRWSPVRPGGADG